MNLHKLVQAHLLKRSALSYTLYPLGFFYARLQQIRRRNWQSKAWQAPCKVISIGNIVSGGSGKTPLTIALAKLLQSHGYKVGISHRGYKGAFERSAMVITEGDRILYPAWQCGDEAHLIASSLPGMPVVVGSNRKAAIKLLLRKHPELGIVIMDDALQHVKVKRDIDIISFAAETGLGNGFVLPAGYLREPLSSLSPDCLAMIYYGSAAQNEPTWVNSLRDRQLKVMSSSSEPEAWVDALGNRYPLESLKGKRLILVSGIAKPESFEQSVRSLGVPFIRHFRYPDHFSFTGEKVFNELNCELPELILCTQKDLMKLAAHSQLKPKLRALVLDYRFQEPEKLMELVEDKLK